MAGCKVIGIFGGVGSGKSEAVEYLKTKYHAYVIKADEMAHRLYKKGQPGYKAVIRCCGKSVLDSGKNIDRTKLAEMLYDNEDLLKEINRQIHPMVFLKIRELITSYKKRHSHGLIVYEAALISGSGPDFLDEKWFVHSNTDVRKKRLIEYRGYSADRVNEITHNQPSDKEYSRYCDLVIENNGTLEELEKTIDEVFKHCERK